MPTASSPVAAATSSRSALPLWPMKMMCPASSPLIHGDTLLVSLATLLRCIERERSRSSSDMSVRIAGLRNALGALAPFFPFHRGERHHHRSPQRQRP